MQHLTEITERQAADEIKIKKRIHYILSCASVFPKTRQCKGAEVSSGALTGTARQVSSRRLRGLGGLNCEQ